MKKMEFACILNYILEECLQVLFLTLPNVSGGAVFSASGEGDSLFGIHLGVHYKLVGDEDESNKLVGDEPEDLGTSTVLTLDDLGNDEPAAITTAIDVEISPSQNTRTRSKFSEDNVKHKGSMSCFTTVTPIARLLAEKVLLNAGVTKQSKKRKGLKP
jgi:hypothetical protein